MRKRNKSYKPKTIRIPMTGLRDTIALHMYAALSGVEQAGNHESFDALANIINMTGLAMEGDDRFRHELRLVSGGAAAMNEIAKLLASGVMPTPRLIAPVRVALDAIDAVLPRMDVSRIYQSEKAAVAMLRLARAGKVMEEAR